MALRTLLEFRNLDRTKDLNDIFVKLITPGIFDGGEITAVPNQLKIRVSPFKVFSRFGMVVEETSQQATLDVNQGQTNVVALRAIYFENAKPDVELLVIEEGVFNGLPNTEDYIVFGHVEVPIGASQVLTSFINLIPRDTIDKVGRSPLRGILTNASALPSNNNRIGDIYVITSGLGNDPTNIYGWNGNQWIIMTDFVQLASDLQQHRNNNFPNEKHLSDDEKQAVVGTSGNPVNSSNKLIDNSDSRIPTQDENDALTGSHGAPDGDNVYVTKELPFASPQEKIITSPTSVINLLTADSPVYIGKGIPGTQTEYFSLYNLVSPREYENSDGTIITITGVFKDSGLTQEITDPSTDSDIDSEGFFTGSLWLKLSGVPTDSFRLLYGKRVDLGTYPMDLFLRRSVSSAQAPLEVQQKFTELSGRLYTDITPIEETNKSLLETVTDTRQYIQTSLDGDVVIEDFERASSVPDYSEDFPKNVGIYTYKYLNTNLVNFTYNSSIGRVTYDSSVSIGATQVEDVFIDGSGIEYKIVSFGSITVDIVTRSGDIPSSIDVTTTSELSGSIKVDNNPRQINFANLKLINHRDRILVISAKRTPNEFHPITGDASFEIASPLRQFDQGESRLRMYGSVVSEDLYNPLVGPTGQQDGRVFLTNEGRISITGYFNDLELVTDLNSDSPLIEIVVDGRYSSPSFMDLSFSGQSTNIVGQSDIKQKHIRIVEDLDDELHTVEVLIPNSPSNFVFYGFHLIKQDLSSSDILPGRAFVQSELYKKDIVTQHPVDDINSLERGAVVRSYINRSLTLSQKRYDLKTFDGVTPPSGTAVSLTTIFTVSSNLDVFRDFYRVNDVVKLATSLVEEVKQINSITDNGSTIDVEFTTQVQLSGSAQLVHLCSTSSDEQFDPVVETREVTALETGLAGLAEYDFLSPIVEDRINILEDSTTKFFGYQISFSKNTQEQRVIIIPDNSSTLRISAVCSKLDIIVSNESSISGEISISGSPFNSRIFGGSGPKRYTLFSNSRYQQYDVVLQNFSGLEILGFIIYEPDLQQDVHGTDISDLKLLARYNRTNPDGSGVVRGENLPLGSYGIDAYSGMGIFVNGSGGGSEWTTIEDFPQSGGYGRLTFTDQQLAYYEFVVYGTSFEVEYTGAPNGGYALIELNNVIANDTNFTAVFRGMDETTGFVDMYNPVPARKRFGISDLPIASGNSYIVRIRVPSPSANNSLSVGFRISVNQLFLPNSNGLFGYGNQKEEIGRSFFGWSSSKDIRNVGVSELSNDKITAMIEEENKLVEPFVIDGGTF